MVINTDLDIANRYWTKMSPRHPSVTIAESQHHVVDPTYSCRAPDNSVEHRLHIRRRAADDAEHLGRCRLMFQRLAQFRIALPEFSEESHVLDGDHRLVGKGFDQLNLPIRKRFDYVTPNRDGSDRSALT